jgi:hypothetical protein
MTALNCGLPIAHSIWRLTIDNASGSLIDWQSTDEIAFGIAGLKENNCQAAEGADCSSTFLGSGLSRVQLIDVTAQRFNAFGRNASRGY